MGRAVQRRHVSQQALVEVGHLLLQASPHRARVRVRAQIVQILQQHHPRVGRGVQHEVHPRPRLAVIRPPHLFDFFQRLQPVQVGSPRPPLHTHHQQLRVLVVDLPRNHPAHLEVLRQPLVEPQRNVHQAGVQQPVRVLVPQVFPNLVAPPRVDRQIPPRRLDEIRPPRRKIGEPRLQVLRVVEFVREQVDHHRPLTQRQPQRVRHLQPQTLQIDNHRVPLLDLEVAHHLQLLGFQQVPRGQRNLVRVLGRGTPRPPPATPPGQQPQHPPPGHSPRRVGPAAGARFVL